VPPEKVELTFAIVTNRIRPQDNFVSLRADPSFYESFSAMQREKGSAEVRVYHFESLGTTLREYKSIQLSEFSP
jgi:hypothetical protein